MMVIGTAITVGNIRQGRLHRSIAAAILSATLGVAAMSFPGALAAPRETAVLPQGLNPGNPAATTIPRLLPAELPPVLSGDDVQRYQRIFAAQASADWALADKLIGQLADPRLLRVVLAARAASRGRGAGARARPPPHAAWVAGLAAWRAGKPGLAIKNFEAVATSPASSSWNASAGAFWAARGYLVTRKPQLYVRWMSRAAESPYTFYGLMARRALGHDINIDWSLPPLGKDDLARLEGHPGALRALALIQ